MKYTQVKSIDQWVSFGRKLARCIGKYGHLSFPSVWFIKKGERKARADLATASSVHKVRSLGCEGARFKKKKGKKRKRG